MISQPEAAFLTRKNAALGPGTVFSGRDVMAKTVGTECYSTSMSYGEKGHPVSMGTELVPRNTWMFHYPENLLQLFSQLLKYIKKERSRWEMNVIWSLRGHKNYCLSHVPSAHLIIILNHFLVFQLITSFLCHKNKNMSITLTDIGQRKDRW